MVNVKFIGENWQSFEPERIYQAELNATDSGSWFVFVDDAPFLFRGKRGYYVSGHKRDFEIISSIPGELWF